MDLNITLQFLTRFFTLICRCGDLHREDQKENLPLEENPNDPLNAKNIENMTELLVILSTAENWYLGSRIENR